MHGAVDVGPGLVNGRMDAEAGLIDHRPAVDDFTLVIHEHEILGCDLAKEFAKRIDPKVPRRARHAQADVPRQAIVEPQPGDNAIGRGQLDALVPALGRVGDFDQSVFLTGIARGLFTNDCGGIGIDHR